MIRPILTFLVLAGTVLPALAEEAPVIYRCTYTVKRANKNPFVMVGNIIPSDAGPNHEPTYLTLQPPSITDINVDARILFTNDDYNPMRLHPRGDTVSTVASALLDGPDREISYVDGEGTNYNLRCEKR